MFTVNETRDLTSIFAHSYFLIYFNKDIQQVLMVTFEFHFLMLFVYSRLLMISDHATGCLELFHKLRTSVTEHPRLCCIVFRSVVIYMFTSYVSMPPVGCIPYFAPFLLRLDDMEIALSVWLEISD